MSDEEEYYDDAFEEEWIFWDEGDPTLADDLAQGTVHSPVYLTDQALYAALESESDWDYFTDEYYDDDPFLLKKQDQTPLNSDGGKYSGKKRKRTSLKDNARPAKNSRRPYPDIDSFCGVIWRTPCHSLRREELYEAGKGETVSLLGNWRELFKYPDRNKSPPALDHHPSAGRPGPPKERHHPGKGRNAIRQGPKTNDSGLSSHGEEDVEDGVDIEYGRPYTFPENPNSSFTPPPCHFNDTEQEIIERSNTHGDKSRKPKSPSRHVTRKPPSRLKQVTTAEEPTPPPGAEAGCNDLPPSPTGSSSQKTTPTKQRRDLSRPLPSQRIEVVVGPPKSSCLSFPMLANDSVSSEEQRQPPLRKGRKRKATSPLPADEDGDQQCEMGIKKRGRPAKTRTAKTRKVTPQVGPDDTATAAATSVGKRRSLRQRKT
ncbi:hypothetical protein D8B26_006056 [Coccidioides posadasii str. Silveira]|nr:hypothetical protein CPAG_04094 [Coccidioides posadasii RMSCC 3488]QVM11408.1 hypothetical protein D8B26_006056 [Coccidioides posadasii str. Silveira]